MTTQPSAVIAERYRLGDAVGRGGMADVFVAVDLDLDRRVAVKVMRTGEAADPSRFQSEMRILGRLEHEAIVRIYDAGSTAEGHPYFVMQLVEGQSLAGWLRNAGPLPPSTAAGIGARVAAALAHAHSRGIVHRDVKPANILVDSTGTAYLSDFGVARLADASVVTHSGTTIGTAAYLAPEQLQDSSVGPSADIYSLGLVLLEALTGQRGFAGTGVEAAMARLARPPDIPADLPPPWPALLAAMTYRDVEWRPDAETVAAVLEGRIPPPVVPPTPGFVLTPPTGLLTPTPPPPGTPPPHTPAPAASGPVGDGSLPASAWPAAAGPFAAATTTGNTPPALGDGADEVAAPATRSRPLLAGVALGALAVILILVGTLYINSRQQPLQLQDRLEAANNLIIGAELAGELEREPAVTFGNGLSAAESAVEVGAFGDALVAVADIQRQLEDAAADGTVAPAVRDDLAAVLADITALINSRMGEAPPG